MPEHRKNVDLMWRLILSGGPILRSRRRLFRLIPGRERCKNCLAPLEGAGASFMRLLGHGRYSRNPRFCNFWMAFCRRYPGGAEIELSMLFADLRGSTAMAERMSPSEFAQTLNRFYSSVTDVLIKSDAYIDKLVADEVVGLYFPLFAGRAHARKAVEAARNILYATGYEDPEGPLFRVGIGVHTGTAYLGTVAGAEGTVTDIAAIGHDVNITARLSSTANAGEVLISEAAYATSGLELDQFERRRVQLKGRTEPLGVRVMRIEPH